jgi:putative FmdB family regulatory protein
MPIYEYQCQSCGRHFEKRQSVTEEPLAECEKCGGKLEKQWSLSGFQFKGEGWYVTDYAAKKGGTKPSSSDKESSAGESTTSADSASKPKSETSKTKEPAKK